MTFSLRFGKQLDDGLPDIMYTPRTMEYKFLKRARIHSLGNYIMKKLHKTFLGGKTFAEGERAKCRGIEIFFENLLEHQRGKIRRCVCVFFPPLLSSGCVLASSQFQHSNFSACLHIANYHSKVKMKAWDTDRGRTTALTTTYIHTHLLSPSHIPTSPPFVLTASIWRYLTKLRESQPKDRR